jgi:hypothetical protein
VEDELSELFKRLSHDMPELMEEVVAFIERRTAELSERDDGAAPRLTESVAPAALVQAAPTPQDDDTGIATISLRFDTPQPGIGMRSIASNSSAGNTLSTTSPASSTIGRRLCWAP